MDPCQSPPPKKNNAILGNPNNQNPLPIDVIVVVEPPKNENPPPNGVAGNNATAQEKDGTEQELHSDGIPANNASAQMMEVSEQTQRLIAAFSPAMNLSQNPPSNCHAADVGPQKNENPPPMNNAVVVGHSKKENPPPNEVPGNTASAQNMDGTGQPQQSRMQKAECLQEMFAFINKQESGVDDYLLRDRNAPDTKNPWAEEEFDMQ